LLKKPEVFSGSVVSVDTPASEETDSDVPGPKASAWEETVMTHSKPATNPQYLRQTRDSRIPSECVLKSLQETGLIDFFL
ncbi:MAG: hypothetical protein ACPG1Z_09595, partial [Planctomycetota bacterium]